MITRIAYQVLDLATPGTLNVKQMSSKSGLRQIQIENGMLNLENEGIRLIEDDRGHIGLFDEREIK